MNTFTCVTAISNSRAEKLSRLTGSFLSEIEQGILESKHPLRQAEFTWGRYCLKKLYQDTIEKIPLREIVVPQDDKGKPFLAGNPTLRCSVSHTGGYVAVGISDSCIGIDIEKIRPHSPALLSYIEAGNSVNGNKILAAQYGANVPLVAWCIKESCMKADDSIHPFREYAIARSSVAVLEQGYKKILSCKVERANHQWAVHLSEVRGCFVSIAQ
jgi:phosphopantetheinyl transferase